MSRYVVLLVAASCLYAAPRNAAPGVAYVGSKTCAGCHANIYAKYVRTAMGRSTAVASAAMENLPALIHSETLNRDFRVFREGDALYQSESQRDGERLVFENKQKIEYTIGSGENGSSFAVRRGNYLFQAPLSYYSKAGKWDLSPGFEQADVGFSRPIYDACIVCHAGRPRVVPSRDGLFQDLPFAELAVGCENCHGPGQLHVSERSKNSIVNPARLESRLAEDICMMCHQGGDARVLLPGRNYSDFRPGTPLVQTVAIVGLPLTGGQTDLLEHHASMKLSKCYRASAGKLSCLSCHDPHQQPGPAEAPAFYRARCLACHEKTNPCTEDQKIRAAQTPSDNCVACHMPKRSVEQISHSALTNHRIPRRPQEPSPLDLPESITAELPGLLLMNARPGEPPLPLTTRLAAYGELSGKSSSLADSYNQLLEEAASKRPDDPVVLSALGRRSLFQGDAAKAAELLKRAVDLGAPGAAPWEDLANALGKTGVDSEAMLNKALALFPYSRELRKRQILAYIQKKDYLSAKRSLEAYVQDFPEDSFFRGLLQKAERR